VTNLRIDQSFERLGILNEDVSLLDLDDAFVGKA
jgi:hypothetical protein